MLAATKALHEACTRARENGLDFPSIWHSLIAGHPLVVGLPVQRMEDGLPVLDIGLLSGQRLRFGDFGFVLT